MGVDKTTNISALKNQIMITSKINTGGRVTRVRVIRLRSPDLIQVAG